MKKLFHLLLLFSAIVINAQTIVSYDFNSGVMGWTLSSNTSVTGGKIFMNGDDGGIRTATSPVIDLTGNSSVSLSVDWNCVDSSSGFESDDRIYIQYLNGSTWSTIWSKTGNDICPNTNDNQSGNTGVLNLPVALSSTRIRLVSDTNSTSEDINWDNVVVSVATASCDPIVWYHTSNDKLFTANLATGQSTEVCSNFDASGSTIFDIGFTPSGSELYAVVSGGTLRRVILPGCTFTTITKAASSPETIPTSSLNSLSFLPDGSALVGSSSTRIIYRVIITGNTYSATQWITIPNENSITGSSGDFILLGDKVYAALTTGSREWLYEIKINPSTYAPISATPSVSIVGKYQGPSGGARMYGMSAIYGKLYGGFDDNTVKEITLTSGSPTGTFSLSSNKLSGFASDDIYGMTSTLEGLGGEDPTISAGGLTSFCPGGSVVLTSEVQQNNQWYKDGEAIAGATGSTYTATTTGEYTVRVSYGTGCFTNFSNPIVVTADDCIDAADDTYTNVPAGSTTASVIVNDTFNGSAATIGTTPGTVTIHTLINSTGTQGAWPTGFTLNLDGTITLATTVAAGTYTLYYKICNQEETVCNIATVTLMVVASYDCTGKIYSLSSTTGEIRVFNSPATSGVLGTVINTTPHPTALSPAPNGPNALGYSNATKKFYYVLNQNNGTNVTFVSYDPSTNAYENLATTDGYIYRGTVTNDGLGYYGITSANTLKYYDIVNNTWTNITSNYVDQNGVSLNTILNTYSGGDIAMDGNGDLWILAGTTSSNIAFVFRVKGAVPKTNMAGVPLVLEQIVKQNIGASPNGISFNSAGELFITNSTTLFKMNSDFTISSIGVISNPANGGGDLASCANPINPFAISDFGDAPDSYKTLLASNGPRHTASQYDATNNTASLMIGSKIDLENEGFPNDTADGDDTNNINDENSVTWPTLNSTSTTYTATIPVVNSTGTGATLKGWIDFNKNGTFDASESASVSVADGATSVLLTWTGLSGLTAGDTYFRLRIAKNAADITLPTGSVFGGEVEDGKFTISGPAFCYEDPGTSATAVPVKHGITVLGRAGADNGNWPMIRNSAYTALESKTKGFVITRMTSDPLQAAAANHLNKITNPVIGMMVFDVFADGGKGCLKINTDGTSTGWKCFNKQACP